MKYFLTRLTFDYHCTTSTVIVLALQFGSHTHTHTQEEERKNKKSGRKTDSLAAILE